jgi:hypothetical protein
MGARNNGERTSEVRKGTIPLRIFHSISNHNPDKRRFRVISEATRLLKATEEMSADDKRYVPENDDEFEEVSLLPMDDQV